MREDDAFMWGTSGFYRYEHLPESFSCFGETSLNHILLKLQRMSPKQIYPHVKIFQ